MRAVYLLVRFTDSGGEPTRPNSRSYLGIDDSLVEDLIKVSSAEISNNLLGQYKIQPHNYISEINVGNSVSEKISY